MRPSPLSSADPVSRSAHGVSVPSNALVVHTNPGASAQPLPVAPQPAPAMPVPNSQAQMPHPPPMAPMQPYHPHGFDPHMMAQPYGYMGMPQGYPPPVMPPPVMQHSGPGPSFGYPMQMFHPHAPAYNGPFYQPVYPMGPAPNMQPTQPAQRGHEAENQK